MVVFLSIRGNAQAQRHRNQVFTADGPVSMNEWNQAGGNIDVYRGIMQQKAMVQQQQAYMKMLQQQQKLDQQAAKSMPASAAASFVAPVQTRARKKRHGVDPAKSATAEVKVQASSPSTDAADKDKKMVEVPTASALTAKPATNKP